MSSIVDLWQVGLGPLPDPWDLRTLVWLAADDLHGGLLFLEESRRPHDRAGGAHARDKVRDAAIGVAPELGSGGAVVRERIIRIGELIEDDALPFVAHALRHV